MNEAQAIRLMEWVEKTIRRNNAEREWRSTRVAHIDEGWAVIISWDNGETEITNTEDAVEFCDWAELELGRFGHGKQS